MFRMIRTPSLLFVAPAVLALLSSGCGSSSSSLTSAQAEAVSQQVSQTVAAGVSSSFEGDQSRRVSRRPGLATLLAKAHPATLSGCVGGDGQFDCNVPVTADVSCPAGGDMTLTGDASGFLDSNGDGSLSADLTVTPAQCGVDGLVLNGNPAVVITSQLNFTDNGITFPATFMAVGDISYGTHAAQSCQINVTYSVTSSDTCVSTGTVCGKPVSGSC